MVKLDLNPWEPAIADQLMLGPGHVIQYLGSERYGMVYKIHHSGKSEG